MENREKLLEDFGIMTAEPMPNVPKYDIKALFEYCHLHNIDTTCEIPKEIGDMFLI